MPVAYENLEDLSTEHKAFLGFLEQGETEPERLEEFFYFLEKIHHHKEESFLFPLLLGSERLQVGGPKCMTFFTPRVLGGMGWVDSSARLGALLPEADESHWIAGKPFREEVFRSGSMLKIPVGDHIQGARALALLRGERNPEVRNQLLSAFSSMLRDHIQREDECLFELFRAALSSEQKKSYAEKARTFDAEMESALRLIRLLIKPAQIAK